MSTTVAIMGFGEAAQAFVRTWPNRPDTIRVFDIKTRDHAFAQPKLDEYDLLRVVGAVGVADAVAGADVILSLVTAQSAQAAAAEVAAAIAPGALFLDMNSVAPTTKGACAQAISAAGGRYVDVAVMAPVLPTGAAVPLLASGPYADAGADAMRELGFADVRIVAGGVGRAAAIKMIRSVMVKGIEALTVECALAAAEAGVLDEVSSSLNAGAMERDWVTRADYCLDRVLVHGSRRAAEMEEAVRTLDALGTGAAMTRGTVERQRALGALGITPPPGLEAKLVAIARARVSSEAQAA